MDAGELTARGFLDRVVVEFHGLDLLRKVGLMPLDANRIADREITEIELYRGDRGLVKKFDHRSYPFFHGANDSIKFPRIQGKTKSQLAAEDEEGQRTVPEKAYLTAI